MTLRPGAGALVTGGAGGIGRAVASALVRAGASVVLHDLDGDAVGRAASSLEADHPDHRGRVSGMAGDVREEAAADDAVRETVARTGRIDVLVTCGGIGEQRGPTVERPVEAWRDVLDVDLTGTYLLCRAAARQMAPADGGVIVTVSSIAGVLGLSGRPAYSAAKAGVSMLTRVLACEWAAHGIRVNAVAPGYIATPMTEALITAGAIDPAVIRRRTPMGRMGSPAEVAEVVAFLAGDRARFVTGAVVPVDGGYMAVGAPGDAWTPAD